MSNKKVSELLGLKEQMTGKLAIDSDWMFFGGWFLNGHQ
jgi:hypothetical protein